MITNRIARFAFYFFLALMFFINAFALFRGISNPEMLKSGTEAIGRLSIKASQERWIVYHVWCIIVLILLGWAELTSKRGLFLLLMFLSMLLFYYPFFTS